MAGEVVVGCLVRNVEIGAEVVEQGKGLAVGETEKAMELKEGEGQVLDRKTKGRKKIRIPSYPCTEYAGAYLQEKESAFDEF